MMLQSSTRSHFTLFTSVDFVVGMVLALGSFVLYALTLVPGVFDGDYGEFQYMPRILGIPHPTGYPSYLLLGWLWSWLPVGSMAFRLNLMSAFWGAVTVILLYLIARQQRMRPVAAIGGAVVMALAPYFWRYAGLAAVYTLHTALLAGSLLLWLRWSEQWQAQAPTGKRLLVAAFVTGLSLTNHPTAAFLVPAVFLFVLAHIVPVWWQGRQGARSWHTPPPREWVAGALAFCLPGLLYLYVPLRLWMIGFGEERFGLQESISKGIIAPFLQWGMGSVLHYITGRSLLGSYAVQWQLLGGDLPPLLAGQIGWPLAVVGLLGALFWLWRDPRGFLLLGTLFVPAAAYAVTYAAEFAARNQIAHLEGHILPALLVFVLWVARGLDGMIELVARLLPHRRVGDVFVALALLLSLWVAHAGAELPTAADRAQSVAMERYWREVLAYPLEDEAALTGHWGDLTAFWYFQQAEALRSDLWTIFPPNGPQIVNWLHESNRPLYLAGPMLDWTPDQLQQYSLIPWGILVRVAPLELSPVYPPLQPRAALFGGQVQLEGYHVERLGDRHYQLWFTSTTVAPTSRDLSISVRLHAADGVQLFQQDGRLASLWYPDGTLPAETPILTVSNLLLDAEPPPGAVVRLVIYDPNTVIPLLTEEGHDVVELGPFQP